MMPASLKKVYDARKIAELYGYSVYKNSWTNLWYIVNQNSGASILDCGYSAPGKAWIAAAERVAVRQAYASLENYLT